MRARRLTVVAIAAAFAGPLVLFGPQPQALADSTTQTSLESGTFARPLHRKMPSFPRSEADAGVEGWVVVSYVISPDGTVGETLIEDSSGRKAFERASVNAIEHWAFEPATMNGEPVEQCHTKVLMLFELEQGRKDKRGAKKAFKNQYKRASQLLEKDELKKARSKIDEIEKNS